MRIIVFGGTTEGAEIAYRLAEAGIITTVCVATDYGSEVQKKHENLTVMAGRLLPEQMEQVIADYGLCVDATHPYAKVVTENIKKACGAVSVRYLRYLRPEGREEGAIMVKDAEEAAAWVAAHEGNVLLATGAKELPKYRNAGPERLYPRVLPMDSSLKSCEDAGIPKKNIIAMQGPFIKELNDALMKQYQIDILVTKNGGRAGGFEEKLASCREAGVTLLVIERPEDQGIGSVEEVLNICLEAAHE